MTSIAIEKGTFIVYLPVKDCDFPKQTVSLPEGTLFAGVPHMKTQISSAQHTAPRRLWAIARGGTAARYCRGVCEGTNVITKRVGDIQLQRVSRISPLQDGSIMLKHHIRY